MLSDVVLDTCVLVHANNRAVPEHEDARVFLLSLLRAPTSLRVDEGIAWPPDNSSSRVWCEYRDSGVLSYGTMSRQVIEALLQQKRVLPLKPAPIRTRQVRRYTGPNLDAVFVKLAVASIEKRLVSHDRGFNVPQIRRKFGVDVTTCAACLADFGAA